MSFSPTNDILNLPFQPDSIESGSPESVPSDDATKKPGVYTATGVMLLAQYEAQKPTFYPSTEWKKMSWVDVRGCRHEVLVQREPGTFEPNGTLPYLVDPKETQNNVRYEAEFAARNALRAPLTEDNHRLPPNRPFRNIMYEHELIELLTNFALDHMVKMQGTAYNELIGADHRARAVIRRLKRQIKVMEGIIEKQKIKVPPPPAPTEGRLFREGDAGEFVNA